MKNFLVLAMLTGVSNIAYTQSNDSLRFETYFQKCEQYKGQAAAFDSSLYWANRMLNEARTTYQTGLANFAKGNIISSNDWDYNTGKFAFPYLVKAVHCFAQVKARERLHHALNTLALCYDRQYNPNNEKTFSKSLLYTSMALKLQHDWTYEVATPFTATFEDRLATPQELREAIKVMHANLAFWEGGPSLPLQMWRNHSLGNLYWHLRHSLTECEPYLVKAASIAEQINDQGALSVCLSALTVFSNQTNSYSKARVYGEKGLNHAVTVLKSDFRESIFRDQLYITYKALGQIEKAIEHKERSFQIAEKVYHEAESKRLTFMRERNSELQKRMELEQQLNEQYQRQQLFGIGLVSLLALVSYIFYSNYGLRRKNREISAALLEGQTTERKRVAADLHDNLGSTLSSLRWSIGAIDKNKLEPREQEVYQHLQSTIEQAYDQVRLLSHNLLPEDLEKQGVWKTLEGLVRKLHRNTPVTFTLQLPDNQQRLNAKTEFELYSICLELINNILKHAHATEASIAFVFLNNELKMTVTDNGKGISENTAEGKGLRNINERVESLKGKWERISNEGQGTKHAITLPLEKSTTPIHA